MTNICSIENCEKKCTKHRRICTMHRFRLMKYKSIHLPERKKYTVFQSKAKCTKKQFQELLIKQNNLCAICNKPNTAKKNFTDEPRRLCIDHDHSTGKIRGLLCHYCNNLLGNAKDSIAILKSSIKYLKASK